MGNANGWNAARAIAGCPVGRWNGPAWRIHDQKYRPDDSAGSLNVSGRFNRGRDQFPVKETWSVLYLALGRDVALAEMIRHLRPELLSRTKNKRLTEFRVELRSVVDCRDLTRLGVSPSEFFHDTNYMVPQELAKAALDRGSDAMLVPSATLLGDNLIIFADNLDKSSQMTIVESVDPRLYVERPKVEEQG